MTQHLLSPLPHGADAYHLPRLLKEGHLIHITSDDKRMQQLSEQIKFFHPKVDVICLPAWDCLPYDRVSPSKAIASERIKALSALSWQQTPAIVITTASTIIQRIPPKALIKSQGFVAKIGDEINPEELIASLITMGYTSSPTAMEAGEFAQRGSIIDIVHSDEADGVRLDFFGDTLEEIKPFDPLTQISSGRLEQIQLFPSSELLLSDHSRSLFRKRYRELSEHYLEDPLYSAINEERHYAGMEHWLPLFYDKMESLFDYLDRYQISMDYQVENLIKERHEMVADYYQLRKEHQGDYAALPPEALYLSEKELKEKLAHRFDITPFKEDTEQLLPYAPAPKLIEQSKAHQIHIIPALKAFQHSEPYHHWVIACTSEGSRQRISHMLAEQEIPHQPIAHFEEVKNIQREILALAVCPLDQGFTDQDFICFSETELFGERILRLPKKRKRSDKFLAEAASLSIGELVVHEDHGIGRFEQLETIHVQDKSHDCLKILYHGGDKLYVPVENIALISRYGSSEEHIPLDKLGTEHWQQRKSAIKQRIKMMADQLLQIAAKRSLAKAPSYDTTDSDYEFFCNRFPYAETDDQLRAMEEIEQDLSSGRPMDRLICGDVGFGKTELAMRAAYIVASQSNAQVAIITPTTLLARQHYHNFKQRFQGVPLSIGCISRMIPPAEIRRTKEGIKNGNINIVIGTHALLAKDIHFKNLSLVVIDEEQLFGVKQKERLKQFRASTHLLSLSATPIPRTLQMSMTGLKELSILATPPVDRLSIRSFTMPFDPMVIRNALMREHFRGGRSFVVVPRIRDLEGVQQDLENIVPELKITQAHGRLSPSQLDEQMNDFYDGKYDILLATNIIGSGIDLPMANTIVICKSDHFGLAQLYQMRGRVGRSKLRAYAYFTVPPKYKMTEQAIKRLEVISHLDALGAGFSLASHDMDMRGFGNLLGEEQSGQVKEVGVELYQSLLQETITATKEAEGQEMIEESWTPEINLGIDILIPDYYVADLSVRLGLYRRIGYLRSEEEIDAMIVELVDRFGTLPDETHHLLEIMRLKIPCRALGIARIDAGPKGLILTFHENTITHPEKIIAYVMQHPNTTKLRQDQKLVIKKALENTNSAEKLAAAKEACILLEKVKGLYTRHDSVCLE